MIGSGFWVLTGENGRRVILFFLPEPLRKFWRSYSLNMVRYPFFVSFAIFAVKSFLCLSALVVNSSHPCLSVFIRG